MTPLFPRKAAQPISRRAAITGAGTVLASGLVAAQAPASAGTVALNGGPTRMPVGNLPGWRQVITEDFNTDIGLGGFAPTNNGSHRLASWCAANRAYGNRIGVYDDSVYNSYGRYDARSSLSVSNSALDIYAHFVNGTPTAAAFFPFRPGTTGNEHTYGRWSYRLRSYNATGTNWGTCSLLWPTSEDGRRDGEIDWPEGDIKNVGSEEPGKVGGFYHPTSYRNQYVIPGRQEWWSTWHVYTIEWLPNSLKCYLGDELVFSTNDHVPATAMKWDTQVGVANDNYGKPMWPSGSAHIQIDWVVAYDPA